MFAFKGITCVGLLLLSGEFTYWFNESCKSRSEEGNLWHGYVCNRTGHQSGSFWDTGDPNRPRLGSCWLCLQVHDRDSTTVLEAPAPSPSFGLWNACVWLPDGSSWIFKANQLLTKQAGAIFPALHEGNRCFSVHAGFSHPQATEKRHFQNFSAFTVHERWCLFPASQSIPPSSSSTEEMVTICLSSVTSPV